ncbi:MAG: hypothetical protein LUI14_15885 [Lachnospiraceae bacterium]|nr:hypothetical protein [Lachnospiraceae bacterium]
MEKLGQLTNMTERSESMETGKNNKTVGTSANGETPSGQSYGYNDQELIRALVKSRLEQKQPLEYEDLDGYEMPPRTQFSMLKKPAVSIKYGKLTFNMACIRLFEGVQYIIPIYHPQKKRMTVVMCQEEEYASVDWARVRQKDGVWVNKEVTSREYVDKLYRLMGWNKECRYKVLGRVANSRDGLVLVFDLEEAVMFESKSTQYVDERTGETKQKKQQVMYYPEYYKDRVGKSYNDYVSAKQMNIFEYLEDYVGNTYSDYNGTEKTDKGEQDKAEKENLREQSSTISDEKKGGEESDYNEKNSLSKTESNDDVSSEDSYSQMTFDVAPIALEDDREMKIENNSSTGYALTIQENNDVNEKTETEEVKQIDSNSYYSGWR